MLTETAEVIESRGGKALVRTLRSEACGSCGASGACEAMGGSKEMKVEVTNHLRAKPGDRVELELPESSFLTASAVIYIIPLACLMGGAVLGQLLAGRIGLSPNSASIILAAIGVGLSLPLVANINRKLVVKDKFIPNISRILPPLEDESCEIEPNTTV